MEFFFVRKTPIPNSGFLEQFKHFSASRPRPSPARMSKKRKASKLSSAKQDAPDQNSRFAADAQFADSEDEFEQGRDRVLLEEAPEAKRRRKLAEQGKYLNKQSLFSTPGSILT